MILERPDEPGKKYALSFTILVHLGLVAALFLGVQWKRSQPEVMEVELWSAQPKQATSLPPPPPPPVVKPEPKPEPKPIPKVEPKPEPLPPKKPDIAVKEEKKKPEPKKPDPPKPEPKPEPKKPEPKPLPKPEVKPPPVDPFKEVMEREERNRHAQETQKRLAALADAEQRASASKRGLADYSNKIRIRIKSNLALPPGIEGNPEAVFEVNQLPTGEVLDLRLKRSSGYPALDSAIERAIRKSSPLPKPDNPADFQRTLEIKYKPFEE